MVSSPGEEIARGEAEGAGEEETGEPGDKPFTRRDVLRTLPGAAVSERGENWGSAELFRAALVFRPSEATRDAADGGEDSDEDPPLEEAENRGEVRGPGMFLR